MFLVKKFFFSLVGLFSLFIFFISNTSIDITKTLEKFIEKKIGHQYIKEDFLFISFDKKTQKLSFKIKQIENIHEFFVYIDPNKTDQTKSQSLLNKKYKLTVEVKKKGEKWQIIKGWFESIQQSKWEYFKENYLMIILPLFVVPILSFIIFKFRKK